MCKKKNPHKTATKNFVLIFPALQYIVALQHVCVLYLPFLTIPLVYGSTEAFSVGENDRKWMAYLEKNSQKTNELSLRRK